jgi:hypothetical protein
MLWVPTINHTCRAASVFFGKLIIKHNDINAIYSTLLPQNCLNSDQVLKAISYLRQRSDKF